MAIPAPYSDHLARYRNASFICRARAVPSAWRQTDVAAIEAWRRLSLTHASSEPLVSAWVACV